MDTPTPADDDGGLGITRPTRKRLPHSPPAWVRADARFFVTVCCAERGRPQLNQSAAFDVMTGALEHYIDAGKWWVDCFLAMPDHWHAIMSFPGNVAMERVIRDWKRFVAKKGGVLWQDGFFDHRLRADENANDTWHYIALNPVRKGLCARPEEWPWRWVPR